MNKKENFVGQRMAVFPKPIVELMKENKLTKALFVTDAGFFPKAKHHYVHRSEGSKEHIIIICIEGRGQVICGGKTFSLEKDEYIAIPKGVSHTYSADERLPWTIYWMHFDGLNALHFIEGISGKPIPLSITLSLLRENTLAMIDEMYSILEESFAIDHLIYCSIKFTFLLGELRYSNKHRPMSISSNHYKIKQALRYMKSNMHRKIVLEEIAEFLNLSISHFCSLFKGQTTYTPIEYLTLLRLQKACTLLISGHQKIKEIAKDVGFDDAYYFSRVFTKMMGESPKSYRNSKNKSVNHNLLERDGIW